MLTDHEFAARLASTLAREGLTLLVGDHDFDHLCDLIEEAGLPHAVEAMLSATGGTAHFALLVEGPVPGGHNATLNNRTALKWVAEGKAKGRYTRVLRPR